MYLYVIFSPFSPFSVDYVACTERRCACWHYTTITNASCRPIATLPEHAQPVCISTQLTSGTHVQYTYMYHCTCSHVHVQLQSYTELIIHLRIIHNTIIIRIIHNTSGFPVYCHTLT